MLKRGGGGCTTSFGEVLLLQKGGAQKVLAILKVGEGERGTKNCPSFKGGGGRKVLPCLGGGGGAKSFRPAIFPFCSPPPHN